MRISMLKTAALAAATTLASAGLVVASGAAANATTPTCGVSVPSISGAAVIRPSVSWISVNAPATAQSGVTSWFVTGADVYRGATKVGSFSQQNGIYAQSNKINLTFRNAWGRGAFSLRNVAISYYTNTSSGTCTLNPAGSFAVRSGVEGNLTRYATAFTVKVNPRGTARTLTVGLHFYSATGWRPWVGERIQFQALVAGKWKTLKAMKLNAKGKATWVRYTRLKFRYRVVAPTWGNVSGGNSTMSQRY